MRCRLCGFDWLGLRFRRRVLGGRFDDPQPPVTNPIGSVTVTFSDCSQGQMVYRIDADNDLDDAEIIAFTIDNGCRD